MHFELFDLQIEVMIHKLADEFPERVRIDVIGRSYENRPIYAVKVCTSYLLQPL